MHLKELSPHSPSSLILHGVGAKRNVLYLWWIGQAGFLIRFNETVTCIDPYLSDYLAEKYRGELFPHKRMMAPPLSPSDVKPCDFLFITHGHSDHFDPLSAGEIATISQCTCIIPSALKHLARQLGIPMQNMRGVTSGESLDICSDVSVQVLPSAHEDIAVDDEGNNFFVGYCLRFKELVIYHSGDCVPFEGQAQLLQKAGVQVALLPINGRDEYRTKNGVIGNFSFEESIDICEKAAITSLVAHHFGMFDFNTADLTDVRKILQSRPSPVHCTIPSLTSVYSIAPDK